MSLFQISTNHVQNVKTEISFLTIFFSFGNFLSVMLKLVAIIFIIKLCTLSDIFKQCLLKNNSYGTKHLFLTSLNMLIPIKTVK